MDDVSTSGDDTLPENMREFEKERQRLNDVVFKYGGQTVKRFFNLDTRAYDDGALPKKTKELLGLTASMVLRCDDCIAYHLTECRKLGVTSDELQEALAIALVVGGSVVIPHLRRALDLWDQF